MGMTERIPDKYSRAISFLAAVDDETFRKLAHILEDADSITDALRARESGPMNELPARPSAAFPQTASAHENRPGGQQK